MPVATIGDADFEREVLRSEIPVLIDFTADWCAPCKTVAPEVEAIATELEGKAKVVKVDIDKSKRIATAMRIQSVPTFVVFVRGRPAAMEAGVLKRKQLRAMVEPFLPRAEGAIKPIELAQLIKEGQVVAVDTRDASSYARTRLPGALHVPLEELETRLVEIYSQGAAPILYCRGGDKTKDIVERLVAAGGEVGFLEGGLLAWEAEGLPVERPD